MSYALKTLPLYFLELIQLDQQHVTRFYPTIAHNNATYLNQVAAVHGKQVHKHFDVIVDKRVSKYSDGDSVPI